MACGFVVQICGLLLIHAVWLKSDYVATSNIWRAPGEQMMRAWAMPVSILIYVIAAVMLYRPGPKEQSRVMRGVGFGILLAMAVVVYGSLSGWVILPVPGMLVAKWIVGESLLSCVLGVVIATLVR